MKIESVYDAAFAGYGRVLTGYDTAELLKTLTAVTPLPEGTDYVASQPELEALPIARQLATNAYGGMPIQIGWCNGHNTKLNCLEYHRDSEYNCGTTDFILMLARREDLVDGLLDTAKVRAFRVPAGAGAWQFWNAERGLLADEETDAETISLPLEHLGLWYWLRFLDEEGDTVSSTWIFPDNP